MKIVMNVLMVISYLVFVLPLCWYLLHMFQQNRYEIKRYLKWIRNNIGGFLKNLVISLIVILALYFIFNWMKSEILSYILSILLLAISGLRGFINEKKKDKIKPLVFTKRVIRQCVTLSLLNILFGILIVIFSKSYLLGLGWVSNYLLIVIMGIINQPLETAFHNKFVSDSKKKLDELSDLIKIGITGSYGKTSTKNILQNILNEKYYTLMTPASFNTPMGICRTINEHLKGIHQIFVCEMGADKVDDIKYLMDFVSPSIGIVSSIGPAHLQTFESMDNIIREKMQMMEMLPTDGLGVLNKDNEYIRSYRVKNNVKIKYIGIDSSDVDYQAINIKYSPSGSSFDVRDYDNDQIYHFETKLLGKHNISNILASIAVGIHLGIDLDTLQKAVSKVKQVEHRLQIRPFGKYVMIDDAFNSNPVGSKMAVDVISMMDKDRIVVTCGMIELGDKQYALNYELGKYMVGKCDYVYLVGKNQTAPIFDGLKDNNFNMENVFVVDKVKEAFDMVVRDREVGSTFLVENDLPDAFNK
ncbi:MAG: UDP-N-acetylmuramoyl-tripeptide--D-alanyl-D-alanine ligase [Erysipelotrichaceae bacterium]